MKLRVSRQNYDRTVQRFLRQTTPANVVQFTNAVAADLHSELQDETPVRTGNLRNGWRLQVTTAATAPALVVNPVEYGPYVNYGTSRMRGRFFLERVVERAPRIAREAYDRLFRGKV